MRVGETPVPIPNTMVKTDAADNTWLETAWEDRWLPDLLKNLSVMRCKKKVSCMGWPIRPGESGTAESASRESMLIPRTYLENFIQNQKRVIL